MMRLSPLLVTGTLLLACGGSATIDGSLLQIGDAPGVDGQLDTASSEDTSSPSVPGPDTSTASDVSDLDSSNATDSEVSVPDVNPNGPQILALTRTNGSTAGGTETVILTVGFDQDFRIQLPTVHFGAVAASSVEALNHGILKVTTPASEPGLTSVTVTQELEERTLPEAFHFLETLPEDYVLITIGGTVEADGVPSPLALEFQLVGDVSPAALRVDVRFDPLNLPLAAPTTLPGDVASAADKTLSINTDKTDGLRLLVLGKNRNLLSDGTLVTLIYNIPPGKAWALTPLNVTATAVGPLGKSIPVQTVSGWLGLTDQ